MKINYVVRAILAVAVISLIIQTYEVLQLIINGGGIHSFLGVLAAIAVWFYGYSDLMMNVYAAWPSLLVILIALLVLKKSDGFTFFE